ncbi:MAG: hypothetical protein HYY24_15240 [Verrucomicrobia bacterium]|nr:hypothetical protein [Verrucomicrobiota bacterium]
MRILTPLLVCVLAILCGCGRKGYTQASDDAGQFILQRALAYGGRPIATNGLPAVGGEWRYVQDEFGVAVLFPASQFSTVDAYLRSAFGPPSSKAGWAVRDIGVAIYLERLGNDTQVGIFGPMSEEQMGRAAQRITEAIENNTR